MTLPILALSKHFFSSYVLYRIEEEKDDSFVYLRVTVREGAWQWEAGMENTCCL